MNETNQRKNNGPVIIKRCVCVFSIAPNDKYIYSEWMLYHFWFLSNYGNNLDSAHFCDIITNENPCFTHETQILTCTDKGIQIHTHIHIDTFTHMAQRVKNAEISARDKRTKGKERPRERERVWLKRLDSLKLSALHKISTHSHTHTWCSQCTH